METTGKASPGSPFNPPPAAIWNNMIDAGQAFANGKLDSGPPEATRSRATDLIKLKNSSGADRAKGEILKIDRAVLTTVNEEFIWLDGVAVTAGCRFGILKEPAPDESIVTAQVSGVCMAQVNVTDASHTFASPSTSHVLQSGTSGLIEILYAPDGTGELECVVRFSGNGTGLPLIRYTITSPDCADGSALAVITAVSCDVTSPAVGDEITLLDEDGWFGGETNATLNGRTGTAHKFNIPSGYDECSYVIITISPAPYEC